MCFLKSQETSIGSLIQFTIRFSKESNISNNTTSLLPKEEVNNKSFQRNPPHALAS